MRDNWYNLLLIHVILCTYCNFKRKVLIDYRSPTSPKVFFPVWFLFHFVNIYFNEEMLSSDLSQANGDVPEQKGIFCQTLLADLATQQTGISVVLLFSKGEKAAYKRDRGLTD